MPALQYQENWLEFLGVKAQVRYFIQIGVVSHNNNKLFLQLVE